MTSDQHNAMILWCNGGGTRSDEVRRGSWQSLVSTMSPPAVTGGVVVPATCVFVAFPLELGSPTPDLIRRGCRFPFPTRRLASFFDLSLPGRKDRELPNGSFTHVWLVKKRFARKMVQQVDSKFLALSILYQSLVRNWSSQKCWTQLLDQFFGQAFFC